MSDLQPIQAGSLPDMVRAAASALSGAQTSAEILEARDMASVAYDACKSAERLARAKRAHDDLLSAIYRAQGEALAIESRAKIRLADEYDAAQERGEVSTGRPKTIPDGKTLTSSDIGVSSKAIHEARAIRNAVADDPGVIDRVIDESLADGKPPTRAAITRAVAKPMTAGDSNKRFYRLVKAWDAAGDAAQKRFLEHIGART